jgi:kynureninase
MAGMTESPDSLLPLQPTTFHILLSLTDEDRHGYAIMQALIARDVIGDFRAPDMMRFGFTPLYIGEAEVRAAVEIIADVLTNRRWDTADYRKKALVT